MKRRNIYLSIVLLLSMASVQIFAQTNYTSNGIYYILENGEASVTFNEYNVDEDDDPKYNDYSGVVVIPSSVTYYGNTYPVTSIGRFAFRKCSGLTGVTIPSSVKSIDFGAFQECSSLTSLTIPSSVTSMEERVFVSCSSLTSVTMRRTTPPSIYSDTFVGLSSTTTLYVPSGSKAAYEANSNWKNAFNSIEELISFSYYNVKALCIANWDTNGDGELSVSEAASVTTLGNVFENNTDIRSFNELRYFTGLTSIGSSAFYGCSGLTSVTIPSSVTYIGDYAFYGCSSLTSVVIPDAVKSIFKRAFYGCSNLTDVTIPNSVKNIYEFAFGSGSGYKINIRISDLEAWNNINFDEYWGCPFYLYLNGEKVDELVIPNTITKIGDYAFKYCNLTSVEIPNSVTNIGMGAFYYCTSLTSIDIPNSVTTIGKYAFSHCTSLTSVDIPNSVTAIKEYTFSWCENLTSVTIPNSVETIEKYAFYSCYRLMNISVGSSVSSIGEFAFGTGCTRDGLIMTVGMETPVSVGQSDLPDNKSYGTLYVPAGSRIAYEAADYWKDFKNIIELPAPSPAITFADANIKALCVANWDTSGDGELSEAEAATVSELGQVFRNNKNITSFNELQYFTGLSDISNEAFNGCSNLTSVIIPSSVSSIGEGAFYGAGLTDIIIPSSVTTIGESAFKHAALNSVTFPNSVTSVGNGIFYATNLTQPVFNSTIFAYMPPSYQGDYSIPTGIQNISSSSFADCTSLTSVTIPNSVTNIDDLAFAGCTGLTSVNCLAENVPTTSSNAFYLTPFGSATLYVPTASLAAYQAAEPWSGFGTIASVSDFGSCGENVSYTFEEATGTLTISGTGAMDDYSSSESVPWYSYRKGIKKGVVNDGVTSIGNYALYNCIGLTSIAIPNSVTSIGSYAFSSCRGLTSIDIPNSVTSIGQGAFRNCIGLTSIDIPNSVTSIGSYAFSGCSGLTSIVIPNSMTSIGQNAFFGCSGLTSIDIPNSVTSIGQGAFSNCSGLTRIVIPNSLTSIGNGAFSNCSGLTSIVIPNSVTNIGTAAFGGCSGLTSISVESGNTMYDSRDNCNAIIETSSNTLLWGCKNTIIPNSVTSIGQGAFSNCSGLTSIDIPNSVTSIGNGAFDGCSGLTSIVIPNSVTSIGINPFEDCSALTSIIVESDNTRYDSRNNCNAIIETSTNALIVGCKTTTIPSSVTSISGFAFNGCSGLTSIVIPNSVTSIGNAAFQLCSSLTSVTCLAENVPTTGSYAFSNTPRGSATLYVPTASLAAYQAAEPWSGFGSFVPVISGSCGENVSYTFEEATGTLTISGTGAMNDYSSSAPWYSYRNDIKKVVVNDGVTSIGGSAFFGCWGMTLIVIPNSVTSIGQRAFSWCSGLTTIDIPNSVTSIGNGAFNRCSGLTSIVIPNSVTSIDQSAFSGCCGLASIKVESGNTMYDSRNNCNAIIKTSSNALIAGCKTTTIPNSVTSIGDYAFFNCECLVSKDIPNSVTSIGRGAFSGCSGLTSIEIPNSVTSIGEDAFSLCI